ncbi:MAG: patatin-like phospholipase family protein, partial [Anaerolineae bacterium]
MSNSKLTRILSIDGGGIRGVIPGQILVVLEDKLKALGGNPDAKISDYFDLIAGTSTGGILACLYLVPQEDNPDRPLYNAQEVVDFYLDRGGQVFHTPLRRRIMTVAGLMDEKYPTGPMESLLAEYFGDLRLSQLIKPCLIPSYDIDARKARFFNQYSARQGDERDYLVREVIRATTAAPSYFEVAQA